MIKNACVSVLSTCTQFKDSMIQFHCSLGKQYYCQYYYFLNFHLFLLYLSSLKSALRNMHETLYPLSILDEMQLPSSCLEPRLLLQVLLFVANQRLLGLQLWDCRLIQLPEPE